MLLDAVSAVACSPGRFGVAVKAEEDLVVDNRGKCVFCFRCCGSSSGLYERLLLHYGAICDSSFA